MHRFRRLAGGSAAIAAVALPLVIAAPTHADDAGIEGQVDSMIELRLDPAGTGRVAATVTTTIAHTRLSVPARGGKTSTEDFAGPVTGKRVVVRTTSSAHAAATTITFGPQGP